MSTSYTRTIDKLNEQGDRLPCRWCDAPTLKATLSQYGARCFSCYEAYCRGAFPPMKGFMDGRPDTPTQAEMRKRLKVDRPVGITTPLTDADQAYARKMDAAKRETARRVAEYERKHP